MKLAPPPTPSLLFSTFKANFSEASVSLLNNFVRKSRTPISTDDIDVIHKNTEVFQVTFHITWKAQTRLGFQQEKECRGITAMWHVKQGGKKQKEKRAADG